MLSLWGGVGRGPYRWWRWNADTVEYMHGFHSLSLIQSGLIGIYPQSDLWYILCFIEQHFLQCYHRINLKKLCMIQLIIMTVTCRVCFIFNVLFLITKLECWCNCPCQHIIKCYHHARSAWGSVWYDKILWVWGSGVFIGTNTASLIWFSPGYDSLEDDDAFQTDTLSPRRLEESPSWEAPRFSREALQPTSQPPQLPRESAGRSREPPPPQPKPQPRTPAKAQPVENTAEVSLNVDAWSDILTNNHCYYLL
jgi:hypothetical protein